MQLLARSSAAALSRGSQASHRAGAAALGRRPARSLLPFAARGLATGVRAAATTSAPAPPASAPGLASVRRALARFPLGGGGARRGLRTSSVVAHGLKAGIVGLPNVGKVSRGGGGQFGREQAEG
jgi:hypothetical protein